MYRWTFKIRFDNSKTTVQVLAKQHGEAWVLLAMKAALYNLPPQAIEFICKEPATLEDLK